MTAMIRMMALIAGTLVLAAANAPAPLTPQMAKAMLDSYGPPGAAWPRFDELQAPILHGLESGDARWLALLPRLQAGGNAAFGESLPIAVSEALSRRPSNVLRILGAIYPAAAICGDIEIEPSRSQLRAYYARTIPAVLAVSAPDLRRARDACLDSLERRKKQALSTKPVPDGL